MPLQSTCLVLCAAHTSHRIRWPNRKDKDKGRRQNQRGLNINDSSSSSGLIPLGVNPPRMTSDHQRIGPTPRRHDGHDDHGAEELGSGD